jgi:copper transport protein
MLHHSVRHHRFSRPRLARLTSLLLGSAAVSATLAWASVHIRLESSVPEAGAVLTTAPEHLELRFSARVDQALSSVTLVTPADDSLSVSMESDDADGRVLVGSVGDLMDGEYLVLWKTVSADGHPVSGEFTFTLSRIPAGTTDTAEVAGTAGTGAVDTVEPVDSGHQPVAAEPGSAGAALTPSVSAVLLAGLGLICLLGFAGLLWHIGSLPLLTEPWVGRTVEALGWSALLLLAADLARWLWNVIPPGTGLSGLTAALATRTGLVELSTIGLVALALVFLHRKGRAAAGLALASVLIGAAAGHTATISPLITMPANAVHLGAVSIWLGGLLLLVLVPAGPTDGSGAWRFADVARAVSAAALLSVVLIAASGIIQSVWLVGDIAAFTGTAYGRGVLAKWVGLAVLIGFGALHRFRVMPALERDGDGRGLRRTVRLETIVMLAVVMLAAWLARVSPPSAH